MKRPSFFRGVIVAAVIAVVASVSFAALLPWLGFTALTHLAIPAAAFVYIAFLLRSSGQAIGRMTILTLWSALAVIAWWIGPPLPLYVLIHVGAMWLVRSLYFYSGVLPALMDLALSTFAVGALVWALVHTGSVFLAAWCFFLVQALFVAIPASIERRSSNSDSSLADNAGFERARRQADQALRQLLDV